MKKVAIIGSGISGTSAAYYLNKIGYDVSIFEKESYFGGRASRDLPLFFLKNSSDLDVSENRS